MGYYQGLEKIAILGKGKSAAEVDLEAQIQYLKNKAVDTARLSAKEIKEYDTEDKVFLNSNIKILDAIEDIALRIGY